MSSRYSLEKGMEKGMEKGRMEGKIDTARKMLAQGEGPRPDLKTFPVDPTPGSASPGVKIFQSLSVHLARSKVHGWELIAGSARFPAGIGSFLFNAPHGGLHPCPLLAT